MGKRSAAPAPAPYVPPAPPPTPVTGTGRVPDADQGTPTEVLRRREEQQQAVVQAPVEPVTPKSTYLDTEDAARKTEREIAAKEGRKQTRRTKGGAKGLLDPALVKKKGLLA